ncbi:hypothetical protein ABK040_011778 [Willaertia magna]
MGAKISRTDRDNEENDIMETIMYCSKRQQVFHYHLAKYEFPPKPQYSHDFYLDNLTKDYSVLERSFNQAKLRAIALKQH